VNLYSYHIFALTGQLLTSYTIKKCQQLTLELSAINITALDYKDVGDNLFIQIRN